MPYIAAVIRQQGLKPDHEETCIYLQMLLCSDLNRAVAELMTENSCLPISQTDSHPSTSARQAAPAFREAFSLTSFHPFRAQALILHTVQSLVHANFSGSI